MKIFKMWFISIMMTSTLITISSYSWMSMWIGLEINSISMIPLMINNNNLMSSESAIKYFISQTTASMMMIWSISTLIMMKSLENSLIMNNSLMITLNSSVIMKMGAAPLHFWFPEIINGLSWSSSMILMTWQKIAPMTILSYMNKSNKLIMLIIISSMVISVLMSLNINSLKKIMTFSSINHMGWMIALMSISESLWVMYMLAYMLININLMQMFSKMKLNNIKDFNNINPLMIKLNITINFMSTSGLPPLIGFLPKWITLHLLMNSSLTILAMIMVMSTLIMIYIYTRMMVPSLMIKSIKPKYIQQKKFLMTLNIMLNSSMIMWMILFN